MVLRVNNRQYRISLGIKVFTHLWDKSKQECSSLGCQNEEELKDITKINQLIYEIKLCYLENIKLSYGDLKSIIKNMIDNRIGHKAANQSEAQATILLSKAFVIQYGENKQKEKKENSTWKQYSRLLYEYFRYMKKENIPNNIKGALSQVAINNYKHYLITRGLAASSINHRVGIIVRLINRKLVIENSFLKYQITPVKYEQVKDTRLRSENIRTALTDEEVKAIQEVKGLSNVQKEYRDIFLMQCYTSMRVSDVRKIFTREYTEEDRNGRRIIIIRAQKSRKEDGYYTILIDTQIQEILDRYKKGFSYIDINVNGDVFQQNLNDSLRKIASKAGLSRVHTYYKSVGGTKEEHEGILCNIITSHFARHTFISKKIREGYSTDEIKNMTAHTDDNMIDKVYRHLTNEDRVTARIRAEKRNKVLRDKDEEP